MASSSSCSGTTRETKFDVFLSFRGEDTRCTFTSHLYAALRRRKINTFIDYDLRKGDSISPALIETIEDSCLSIIILSENYASSTWCLDELVKIVECKETKGQIILPVFYHVVPSHVRKQTGSYGEAFAKHEKRFKETKDKVSSWRAALTEVANLSGWDIKEHDGPESEFVEKIVQDVLKKLKHMSLCDHLDGLVGILPRLEEVDSLLCIGTADFRTIGIWGMPGIGKTTIARAIFNRIANKFEGSCFLENVREEAAKCGLNNLQEKILSEIFEDPNSKKDISTLNRLGRMKVLIVLDDVNNTQHLKYLIGDRSWFCHGSRIIITSRDKQVLNNVTDIVYEVKELDIDHSLQLFSLNAFKQSFPIEEYLERSHLVVYYADGNPLVLKALGRFLEGRSKREWKSLMDKLKKCPNLDIQNVLRISYNGLDDQEKEIFLNIACFFKGERKHHVTTVLDEYGLSTEIGISVLVDKCLITIRENKIQMHDLIEEMGHNIVLQESIKEPGKRSRLWDPQDICNLFKKNKGTDAVESISLDLSQINEMHLNSDAFKRIPSLRLLKFYSSRYSKGMKENDMVQLCGDLEFLPDELRYLHWHRYPLRSLPSEFKPESLVDLQMHHSNVEHLWNESQWNLEKLRRIDLSYSQHLTEIPNLSGASNLQTIVLNGCSMLTKFPQISWNIKELCLGQTAIEEVPSTVIERLNQLVSLKLNYCSRLKNLPSNIRNLTSLTELSLQGCSSITEFPDISTSVFELNLDLTAVEQVPSSIEHLTNLWLLSLVECTRLKRVSGSIFKLKFLEYVLLSRCSKLEDLPEVSESNGNLRFLLLDRTAIKKLPASIELLRQLSHLNAGLCKNIENLPNGICNMNNLSFLNLSGCGGVEKMLEDLPLSSFSGLGSLKQLYLRKCNLSTLPSALSHLSLLEHLNLHGNNFESLNLEPFSCLKILNISHCKRLQSLEKFPFPSRLLELHAHQCISLETLPILTVVVSPTTWRSKHSFIYSNCLKLDADARRSIMVDAWIRIKTMATETRLIVSLLDNLKIDMEGGSFCFCFPGNEIPEWFGNQSSIIQNGGSSVIIELHPHRCSTEFLGLALCIVAEIDVCQHIDLYFQCKCSFDNGVSHEFICYLKGVDSNGIPGILESDHLFLLYNTQLSGFCRKEDGEHNLRIFSSRPNARFEISPVDMNLQPLPNCKIKKCGVHLLYKEEETTQNSLSEARGDGISNVKDQEDPKSKTLQERVQNEMFLIEHKMVPVSLVSLFYTGNEIPEWVRNQNSGSSVTIELPLHWYSRTEVFSNLAFCFVAALEDCEHFDINFQCKCFFSTNGVTGLKFYFDYKAIDSNGIPIILDSDHGFLVGLSFSRREDREHYIEIFSSCRNVTFEVSPVDKDLQPITNCKIKKCGVLLPYSEEETTQKSGDGSVNEAGVVESGGDDISNVKDQEDPKSTTILVTKAAVIVAEILLIGVKEMPAAAVSCCYYPGNKIPEWFCNQNSGSSVTIELPPHWCSTEFLGFAFCIVAAFEDCEHFDFNFLYRFLFEINGVEAVQLKCLIKSGISRILESDHVFQHVFLFNRRDIENNFMTFSSNCNATFKFSTFDENLQPVPNCKIKKCGVHLLYLKEETTKKIGDDSFNVELEEAIQKVRTLPKFEGAVEIFSLESLKSGRGVHLRYLEEETSQKSGYDSFNEAGLAESGGDGISNVEAEDDPNSKTLEEETEHNSESESAVDTLLFGKSGVKLMSKKVFLVGLAPLFLWWCFCWAMQMWS
ncbi:hypothetical protein Ddye_018624 [Dipteronia dyeriana]|uniref:ADP-ribosyl cyclase/cyclic ADP-ribose hydrolase n=1 Tax=Dipteronia dyeriana TaxID=168575 RepID=A0AAD9X250_9ROSI|nr:hypothetical protein Ddye_018624 [Dipteronia dyeriana]